MTDEQKDKISKVVELANAIIGIIYEYDVNRPGSIALTKIEECLMWCQVMIANTKPKPLEGEFISAQSPT